MEERADLLDQWETLQSENVKAQKGAGWGKMLGMGAAMLIPGLPLWGAMLAAGLASRAGSEIGEHGGIGKAIRQEGGVRGAEGIKTVGTGAELRRGLQSGAEDAYGGFGDEQTSAAIKDAISTFALGGGDLTKPTSILSQLGQRSRTGLGSKSLFDIFKPEADEVFEFPNAEPVSLEDIFK